MMTSPDGCVRIHPSLNLHIRWRPWLWLIPALLAILLAVRQQLNIDFLLANPAG